MIKSDDNGMIWFEIITSDCYLRTRRSTGWIDRYDLVGCAVAKHWISIESTVVFICGLTFVCEDTIVSYCSSWIVVKDATVCQGCNRKTTASTCLRDGTIIVESTTISNPVGIRNGSIVIKCPTIKKTFDIPACPTRDGNSRSCKIIENTARSIGNTLTALVASNLD